MAQTAGEIVLTAEVEKNLRQFLRQSTYAARGGLVTDLDGTIVHEAHGRIYIPEPVERALQELYQLGRPLLLNTLRFPLSVLRTFGPEWYALARSPIPVVTLNGSQFGFVAETAGELLFEEVAAFPLTAAEIDEVLIGVKGLLDGGINELLVFYYPRDWRLGEIIWTPSPAKVAAVKDKYRSASAVSAVEFEKLRAQLQAEEICMLFLLIDAPHEQLMAYQHTKRSSFFTHKGVDKLSGAEACAAHLGMDLAHSIGAGDTELDKFLSGVGLAILVGEQPLEFRGLTQTIKLRSVFEFGALLWRLAALQREVLHGEREGHR